MNKRLKQIHLLNLDKRFAKMRFEPKPKSGWIKTIREALLMPLAFPASKLRISRQSVSQLEQNEIEENITLKSLRQLAESIGCEFHYVIIPHGGSLRNLIKKRAEEKARAVVKEVNKTMALEDQKINDSEASIKLLAKEFAEELSKNLWSDDEN
jgi:predicted DNA-binding mobile mystery protein A